MPGLLPHEDVARQRLLEAYNEYGRLFTERQSAEDDSLGLALSEARLRLILLLEDGDDDLPQELALQLKFDADRLLHETPPLPVD